MIARVQSTENDSVLSPVALNGVTPGNTVVVCFANLDGAGTFPPTAISDNKGNTYVKAVDIAEGGADNIRAAIWYAANVVGGDLSLTITYGMGGAESPDTYVIEYSGCDPTAPVRSFNSAADVASDPVGPALAAAQATDMLVTVVVPRSATENISAPWATIPSGLAGNPAADYLPGVAGTFSASCTPLTAQRWCSAGIVLKAAPLPPTPPLQKLLNAQASDANLPVALVQLVLGNYASAPAYGASASSSGDDASGNYPAAGAIDGDRTEINTGPASGADNNKGKSSWRSGTAPDASFPTPVTLTVNFNTARTINRIKLYHLSGHSLNSFTLQYWNGAAFVNFASTTLGATPTNIVSTGTLDVVDFPDITTTQIQLSVFHTTVPNDLANVVEIEAYRKLDITDRVKSVVVSRQRDYKLANPMAAKVTLECVNNDRFFSLNHVPTAAEAGQGFVNPELTPNMQILVNLGFNVYDPAGAVLLPSIAAYCDSINVQPKTRSATITGRDGMKGLINQVDSCNLKTNVELSQAIQYILNRNNISSFECAVHPTNIFIPYFFTSQEDHLTTIRNLTQAAGDSLFYFDESGIAVFAFYLGGLATDYTWPVNAPFSSGTFGGSMIVSGGELEISGAGGVSGESNPPVGFSTGFLNIPASVNRVTGVGFRIVPPISGVITQVNTPFQFHWGGAAGTIGFRMALCSESGGAPGAVIAAVTANYSLPGTGSTVTVGAIGAGAGFNITAGTPYWITFEESLANPLNCAFAMLTIDVASGSWSGAVNSKARFVPHGTTTCPGNPASTTAWQDVEDSNSAGPIGNLGGSYTVQGAALSGSWTSPLTDLGVGVLALGLLTPVQVANGATIGYSTQTSPDGISFSGFTPVAGNGQIQSPTARYLQVQVNVSTFSTSPTPTIQDITAAYTGGSGQKKYPSAPAKFTFAYNSNLMAAAQELADNLGGDTSILNDITVQAQPLVLQGTDTDTVWQGTVGNPPVNISVSNPLPVHTGDVLVISPIISGGMDTSRMDTSSPARALTVISSPASGVVGGYAFLTVNPTMPVFIINIIGNGVLTDLRMIGKTFSSGTYLQAQAFKSAGSIAKYGDRQLTISNPWIVSATVAAAIAAALINNFANPFSYIPTVTLQPTFSAHIGDRVTVVDVNLDLSNDYVIVGLEHKFAVSGDRGDVQTMATLLAIPAADL